MSISSKIERLKKALSTEEDPDILLSGRAILSGMLNFKLGLKTPQAKQRFIDFCKSCEHNVEDPVEDMREVDKQIPDLSGKMCDYCGGCVLSYKIRQTIKPCDKWKT